MIYSNVAKVVIMIGSLAVNIISGLYAMGMASWTMKARSPIDELILYAWLALPIIFFFLCLFLVRKNKMGWAIISVIYAPIIVAYPPLGGVITMVTIMPYLLISYLIKNDI